MKEIIINKNYYIIQRYNNDNTQVLTTLFHVKEAGSILSSFNVYAFIMKCNNIVKLSKKVQQQLITF